MERRVTTNEMRTEVQKFMESEGFENPILETMLLVEHVFGNGHFKDRRVGSHEVPHLNEHMEELRKKVPIQRQLGYTLVNGQRINITSDVLLPGPEIDVLLGAFFDYVRNPKKVIDICTGCGVLASIIGERYPKARVYATDLSERALDVARSNVKSYNVVLSRGDLFEPLEQNGVHNVDVLVSNPPYCRTGDIPSLPQQIRDHTPKLAIDGGEDGYFFHRRIINGSRRFVREGGLVILENEAGQSDELRRMFEKRGYKIECTRKNDRGEERVIVARRMR